MRRASKKFEEGVPAGQLVADVIGNWVLPGVGGGYETYQKRKMMRDVGTPDQLASMDKADEYKKYEMLQEDPLKEIDYSKQLEEFDWDQSNDFSTGYSKKERNDLEKLYTESLSSVDEKELIEATVVFHPAK